MLNVRLAIPNETQRFAAKKRGAFRSDYVSTETEVTTENKPYGNHSPPHVFLGAVGTSFQFHVPVSFIVNSPEFTQFFISCSRHLLNKALNDAKADAGLDIIIPIIAAPNADRIAQVSPDLSASY